MEDLTYDQMKQQVLKLKPRSKMIVSKIIMAQMIAHGMPTADVAVYDPEPVNGNRFSNVDLTNKARKKVKCDYGVKQRKCKNRRKS